MLGLNTKAFSDLLKVLKPLFVRHFRSGRRPKQTRVIEAYDGLGVVLYFMNSTYRHKALAQMFGVVPKTISTILTSALPALRDALKKFPEALVRWPTPEQMQASAERIDSVYDVKGVFGFVDGLNLHMQSPGEKNKQNRYYNGWLHGVFASSVIVYDSFGKVIWVIVLCFIYFVSSLFYFVSIL